MGMLVGGVWKDQWYDTKSTGGRFVRWESRSFACPWTHRAFIMRALKRLEERLASRRYLLGDRPVETDWRLFTTLVRFDAVYCGHFKCNLRRLVDYPNLWDYARDLFRLPGIAKTVNFDHIRGHYYGSHKTINPNGIIPIGPELDFSAPHTREIRT